MVFGFSVVFSLGAAADSDVIANAGYITFEGSEGVRSGKAGLSRNEPSGVTTIDPYRVGASGFDADIQLLNGGTYSFQINYSFYVNGPEKVITDQISNFYTSASHKDWSIYSGSESLVKDYLILTSTLGDQKIEIVGIVDGITNVPAEIPKPSDGYLAVAYMYYNGTIYIPPFVYSGPTLDITGFNFTAKFLGPIPIFSGGPFNCDTCYQRSELYPGTGSYLYDYIVGSSTIHFTSADPPAEDLLTAIEQQTEDMNNNHDETMGKLDDMTSFDDQEQSSMTGDLDGQQQVFEEKLGILSFADQLIEQLLGLFEEGTSGRGLVFPAFNLSVGGESYSVWKQQVFDLSNLDTWVGDLMTVVRFATSFLVWAALVAYIQKIFSALVEDWSDK